MSLILIGTILSGLLCSKLLLLANVDRMIIRYPIVVFISYLFFFLFIRIWLSYIKDRERFIQNALDASDLSDVIDSIPDSSLLNAFDSGGGSFGGGGVSGTFGEPEESIIGDTAGAAAEGIADEGAIILIPLMLILAAIFGAAMLLIYQAPLILTEAAFEFVLAGALLKKAKEIDNPYWMGSVLKNTWKPFLITLSMVFAAALVFTHFFPEATRLAEIIQ